MEKLDTLWGYINSSTWTEFLFFGVVLCAVAPLIRYLVILYIGDEDKRAIRSVVRQDKLESAQEEFEARKKQREQAMKRFEEKQGMKNK